MNRKLLSIFAGLYILLLLYACSSTKSATKDEIIKGSPKADREFRAAWVATVANINWPSKPGLTDKEQQDEAIALLDFLQQHHFNAVILQVRPQCDALYKSDLEPWSYYLTGQQGKAPDPYYDPLEFWIEAAHDRGLELHVWLNPYRAHHKDGKEISDQSIVKTHPELVVKLKEGYWWLDPAMKGTQDHTVDVVMDIVKRYDIDGVHFDDYFYPYPSYNGNADFPDSASWTAYQQSGGKLSRGDWRRKAVNTLIKRLYKNIKEVKPYVKFGLSPFGIWRPGYPESISGFDQYDQLYADARLWLNKGWVDYFSPQLYWPINRMPQSFPVLLGWWSGENTKHRHLWPGVSVGRDTSAKNVNETLSELMITRGMLPQSKGIVHWSISSLTKNPNMANALLNGPYHKQALVPASPWLNKKKPAPPAVTTTRQDSTVKINWAHPDEKDVFQWIVYYKYGNNWSDTIMTRNSRSLTLSPFTGENVKRVALNKIAVTAVDRTGNESAVKEMDLSK
ncbi:MAG: family 10 glycosylhydrolase [Bacteroidota bacterium]|nr:family 10 glycosylhydrolase [Bacteroidota bacterium]